MYLHSIKTKANIKLRMKRKLPVPVIIAGSIQLVVPSQLRLCETREPGRAPTWFTLDVDDDEEEDDDVEFGRPPKLMFIFGRSALNPSCHSLTFIPSAMPPFSAKKESTRT